MRQPIRVYADTSVFGGVFDDEFNESSHAFFDEVRTGRFGLVISKVVIDELSNAPEHVQTHFQGLQGFVEVIDPSKDALELLRDYLNAGIVSNKWRADALHVAIATVSACRAIVSWNFRHIVHFEKIPLYNGVNLAKGYGTIAIHTPQEVVAYEDENL